MTDIGKLKTYHMLENLLELRVRVVRSATDIVICKFVTQPFVELLQYLPYCIGVNIDKLQELYEIEANFPVVFS